MQKRLIILFCLVWLVVACGGPQAVEPIPLQTEASEPLVLDANDLIDNVSTEDTASSEDTSAETEDAQVEATDVEAEVVDSSAETDSAATETNDDTATYRGVQVGFTEEGHPYMGNPDAVVLIEEFSDFQCPFCARFHSDALAQLIDNELASGDALFIFRDFPLSIHAQAPAAANAARCAGEQGPIAYWQMHDKLFETLGEWGSPNAVNLFAGYAGELGLDSAEFSACLAEERYAEAIQADFDDGAARGIRGTPGFIVNGQALSGAQPYQVFSQAIARGAAGEPVVENAAPANPDDIQVPEPVPVEFSDNVAGAQGDPDAPVVLIEFTDYQCPFCARHSLQTMPSIVSEYIDSGRIYYVQKDLPLDQLHPFAREAAVAARCAGEFEKYWEMHDILFAQQSYWAESADRSATFAEFAEAFGIDSAEYLTCLASGKYDTLIEENVQEALELGISGTPFFIVNGFPVVNGAQPFDVFKQVIELAENDELVDAIMDAQRRQIAAQQQQQQAPITLYQQQEMDVVIQQR
ncbi:MAG: thioredoxin domain-containing protein [Candidatus Promineifilaceae bacterium]